MIWAPRNQHQPLSKRDKFYMGKPITEDYAKEFDNSGILERIGIEFGDGSDLSIGGINLSNVFRGIKKALGLGGSAKKDVSGGDEL